MTLNKDNDPDRPGTNLWWRLSTDGADVASASAQIQATFPATAVGFVPSNVIVATWCVLTLYVSCSGLLSLQHEIANLSRT